MTDVTINDVKENFEKWKKIIRQKIDEYNLDAEEKLRRYNEIESLLEKADVQSFAKLINYQISEKPTFRSYDEITLSEYLKRQHYDLPNLDLNYLLSVDKYPIFCYVRSYEPRRSVVTRKFLNRYDDLYYSIEFPGRGYLASDYTQVEINRKKFKEKYDIIYIPGGITFQNQDLLYDIQAEYVEEAIKTNQETAKRLILSKYGKNTNK